MSGPPGCCGTLRQAPTWPAGLRSAGARPRPRSSAHTTHHSVTSYTLPRITSQQSPGVLCCATSFRLNVRPPATPASDASRAPALEGSPSGGIPWQRQRGAGTVRVRVTRRQQKVRKSRGRTSERRSGEHARAQACRKHGRSESKRTAAVHAEQFSHRQHHPSSFSPAPRPRRAARPAPRRARPA